MTRWAELPPRPAVLVEAPEELSRCVEGASRGADLARTMQARTFWPEPRRTEPSNRDLDPLTSTGGPRAELLRSTCPRWVRRRVLTRLAPGHLLSAAAISAAHREPRSPTWALRLPQDSGRAKWTEGAADQTHRASVGCTSTGMLSVRAPHACPRVLRGLPR